MGSIEDHHEELEGIIRELATELDKLSLVHGVKRQRKYKFIKERIARGKACLRSLKLETRGLAEEKQTKWKDIAAKYELKLNEASTDLEFKMTSGQKEEDKEEDFFDNETGAVSAAHKTTKQVMDKGIKIQEEDIGMLEGMVQDVTEMNTLGAETLTTMKAQGEQLDRVEGQLDTIEGTLKEAGRELRTLARRMKKDKICLGFTLLVSLSVFPLLVRPRS